MQPHPIIRLRHTICIQLFGSKSWLRIKTQTSSCSIGILLFTSYGNSNRACICVVIRMCISIGCPQYAHFNCATIFSWTTFSIIDCAHAFLWLIERHIFHHSLNLMENSRSQRNRSELELELEFSHIRPWLSAVGKWAIFPFYCRSLRGFLFVFALEFKGQMLHRQPVITMRNIYARMWKGEWKAWKSSIRSLLNEYSQLNTEMNEKLVLSGSITSVRKERTFFISQTHNGPLCHAVAIQKCRIDTTFQMIKFGQFKFTVKLKATL